jgi:hypothetical protein
LPERYRSPVKDYVLSQMFAKDKNASMVGYHEGRWQRALMKAREIEMKRKQGDVYSVVKANELLDPDNIYGGI